MDTRKSNKNMATEGVLIISWACLEKPKGAFTKQTYFLTLIALIFCFVKVKLPLLQNYAQLMIKEIHIFNS